MSWEVGVKTVEGREKKKEKYRGEGVRKEVRKKE
jgi:hypothetical protein